MSGEGLLPDEPGIWIQRSAIRALGAHDLAAFVQQVHYSSNHGAAERDGYRWAVRSLDEWCKDCVLSPRQAERIIATLVKRGIIVRWQPSGTMDRRAWTRIDWAVLKPLLIGGMHRHESRGHSTTNRVDTAHAERGDVPITENDLENHQITNVDATSSTAIDVTSMFEQFWRAYPRKVGKPAAARAWKAEKGDAVADEVAAGLRRWVESWQRDKTAVQYIPHPSTWLNQRRWEDVPPPPSRNGRPTMMDGLRELEFDPVTGALIE